MKRLVYIALFLISLAGCRNAQLDKAQLQITKLQAQNTTLSDQVALLEKENTQLTKQIQTLRSFGTTFDYKDIYDLQRINITNYTNIYDSNNDGKKETLIVYIQPIDATNDAIKAAGFMEVQLWDLDKPAEQALLKQWKIEPDELKKHWINALLGTNYRLNFSIEGIVSNYDHALTVKVKFTDYLSGKQFEEQKVISPR